MTNLIGFYLGGLVTNIIPIIIVLAIGCHGDGCMGVIIAIIAFLVSALIYLPYLKLSSSWARPISLLIIYLPTIISYSITISVFITNDVELKYSSAECLCILPNFIYNIFISIIFCTNRKRILSIFLISLFFIFLPSFINIFYSPNRYVFKYDLGVIETDFSLDSLSLYLTDSTNNKYKVPKEVSDDLGFWWPNSFKSEADHLLYFEESPKELIQIEIINFYKPELIKVIGIYKLERNKGWKKKFKDGDGDAVRAFARIEKLLNEINTSKKYKIKSDVL